MKHFWQFKSVQKVGMLLLKGTVFIDAKINFFAGFCIIRSFGKFIFKITEVIYMTNYMHVQDIYIIVCDS